jgi:DNA replication protein DnaC
MMMAVSEALFTKETRTIECEKHGPQVVEVVLGNSGKPFGGEPRCPVCKKESEESLRQLRAIAEAERVAREAESNRIQRIEGSKANANIPLRFKEKTLDTYIVSNEGQQKALDVARWYVENWPEASKNGTGLIFSGKAGSGKTHIACGLIQGVNEQGGYARFMTVADAMRFVKRSFKPDADMDEDEAIDRLARQGLLVLDEVGMDYGTDFNKALLFDILNKRYELVNPTILLTNLDPAALREYLGERLIDRMREGGGKMVTFTWESYRGKV